MAKKRTYFQYAALPFAMKDGELHVMLITSRETGRWVIPKGWPEKTLAPHQVAEREAYEEAGLKGHISRHPYASFDYLKRMENNKRRHCTVQVFPLQVREELDDWPEKGQRKREWVRPAEAALRVAEVKLVEMMRTLAGLENAEANLSR